LETDCASLDALDPVSYTPSDNVMIYTTAAKGAPIVGRIGLFCGRFGVRSRLEGRTQLPPLDLEYGEETRLRLPSVYGGPSVALARGFKIVDPHLKNPQTQHRETTFRLFDLLL
jgi:hypothetical protein